MRDKQFYYSQHIRQNEIHVCASSLCPLRLPRVTQVGIEEYCEVTVGVFVCFVLSQLRNPELRQLQSFILGCKHTHPTFTLEEDSIFTNLPSSLEQDTISIFLGSLLYTSLKR